MSMREMLDSEIQDMFQCVCVQSVKPLFSEPQWPCLGRVMINDCFPVIYLQENGWSWPVWLVGGEMRKRGHCR